MTKQTIQHYNLNTIEGRRLYRNSRKATTNQKARLAAQLYGGFKLRSIDSSATKISENFLKVLRNSEEQLQITSSIAASSLITNTKLEEIEKSLVKVSDTQEKAFMLQRKKEEREKLRDLKADQRTRLKDLEEERLNSLKESTFLLHREQEVIYKSNLTNLERYYTLKKLFILVTDIKSSDFIEVNDKRFKTATEDNISDKLEDIQNSFSYQDKRDLEIIEEIESVDEDKKVKKLLEQVTKDIDRLKHEEYLLNNVYKLIKNIRSKLVAISLTESRKIEIKLKDIRREIDIVRRKIKL